MSKIFETIMKLADELDILGRRDLADALDIFVKEAANKPRFKVGDKVTFLKPTPLPVVRVQVDPRFGPVYFLGLWALERDLSGDKQPELTAQIDKKMPPAKTPEPDPRKKPLNPDEPEE